MLNGVQRIEAERDQQVRKWNLEHDLHHDNEELVMAAIVYASGGEGATEGWWPWDQAQLDRLVERHGRNTEDAIHNLACAGALIAAEIDRLQTVHDQQHAAVTTYRDGSKAAR